MPAEVDRVLAVAFGDDPDDAADRTFWEREARVTAVAAGFSRSRDDVKSQLAASEDPVAELRKLERAHQRLRVGIVQRSDRREMDALVTSNRAKHQTVLEETTSETRAARMRLTLGQRLDAALRRAEMLTTVPAGAAAVGSRAKPSSTAPPKALNVLRDASVVRNDRGDGELTLAARYRHVMGQFVERLELEVDASGRRVAGGSAQSETQEARDARLLRWEGIASHVVATLDPTLGSPRTIENGRDRLGKRRSDGTMLPPPGERRPSSGRRGRG